MQKIYGKTIRKGTKTSLWISFYYSVLSTFSTMIMNYIFNEKKMLLKMKLDVCQGCHIRQRETPGNKQN